MNPPTPHNPLPKVRTPLWSYWREFRVNFLPPVCFALILFGIVACWGLAMHGGNVPGIAIGARSLVTAPQAGHVQRVWVRPFQWVQAGDPLLTIQPSDPRTRLDLIQSELNLAQLRQQPSPAEGNAMDYERLRIESLRTQSELAVARTRLHQAERDLNRNLTLHRDGLISAAEYELSLLTRDALKSEIDAKATAVDHMGERLNALAALGIPRSDPSDPLAVAVSNHWASLETLLEGQWQPATLLAPIAGMVQSVTRQTGENVAEGEYLVSIHSAHADHIVGYLRQPFSQSPEPGIKVVVTTRGRQRRQGHTQITAVGAHMEVITNSLAIVRQEALVDTGLPIQIALPKDFPLRPGEIVDLQLATSIQSDWPSWPSWLTARGNASTPQIP